MGSWSPPAGTCGGIAFTFDFDAEEVWIGDDPANADRPVTLSQGTYGAKVGVPQVLRLLRRHEVPATFFVPGRVAERHPRSVEAILAAGHDVGCHGYTHRSPPLLTAEEEAEELDRSLAALRAVGAEPRGYRSPSWELTSRSLRLVADAGLRYSSNFMDDIVPYVHADVPLVELPVHWMLDDAPHFWFGPANWNKKISTVPEVREIWRAEIEGILDLGGLCVLTMHPQVIGRPSRLHLLDELLGWMRGREDVWITTCSAAAEHLTKDDEPRCR